MVILYSRATRRNQPFPCEGRGVVGRAAKARGFASREKEGARPAPLRPETTLDAIGEDGGRGALERDLVDVVKEGELGDALLGAEAHLDVLGRDGALKLLTIEDVLLKFVP